MDINGREKAKRFWIVASLLGICMFVTAIFCFFHTEKNEAEKRMVEIVNYVKVQCSTYTHYNESSESKSLLRAIESARQMSTNIDMEVKNRKQLDRKLLKENLQSLWVDGILVLDEEGKKVCEYSMDEGLMDEMIDYLQKDIIMDYTGYKERSYSERIVRRWIMYRYRSLRQKRCPRDRCSLLLHISEIYQKLYFDDPESFKGVQY